MAGYVTPSKVFSHLDRLSAWKAGTPAPPVTLEWDLCNRCSLGCQDCHFAHTHVRGPWAGRPRVLPLAYEPTGDVADVALVRRALQEAARTGVKGVVWSGGGEPTMHPSWPEIVAYGASLGLEQGMYTLGGHFQPDTAAALADVAQWVVVSLDACTAADYAAEKGVPAERFEAACDGVRMLTARASRKAVIGVSFLLHGGNWERTPEMLRLARHLGATYTTFRPAIVTSPNRPGAVSGWTGWISEASQLLKFLQEQADVEISPERFAQYRDWRSHGYAVCHGVKLNATVTPDGRVWLCPQRRGVAGSCIGDLRTETFGEIWARRQGQFAVDSGCRAMCRLHQVNRVLVDVYAPHKHVAFV